MAKTSAVQFETFLIIENITFISDVSVSAPLTSEKIQLSHIIMIVITGVWYLICIFGVWANFLNIRTFSIMGLQDSITISFFCLSISDLNICSVSLIETGLRFLCFLEMEFNSYVSSPPLLAAGFCVCLRTIFNTSTVFITTFIAVQRWMCIVIPFHAKGISTRLGTICVMTVIFVSSTLIPLLYFRRQGTIMTLNDEHRVKLLINSTMTGEQSYKFLFEIALGIDLPLNLGCQVVVLASFIIMGVILQKSIPFHQSAPSNNSNTKSERTERFQCRSLKEAQVLIQVYLVSFIFIINSMPYMAFGVARSAMPAFGQHQASQSVIQVVVDVMFTAVLVNASLCFVVHYKCNSRFRSCLSDSLSK